MEHIVIVIMQLLQYLVAELRTYIAYTLCKTTVNSNYTARNNKLYHFFVVHSHVVQAIYKIRKLSSFLASHRMYDCSSTVPVCKLAINMQGVLCDEVRCRQ